MLRLALIENLRRVVAAVTAGRTDRQRAKYWVDRMLETAAAAPARVVSVLAEMVEANPPLTNSFVAEFSARLQGKGPALLFPIAWLEQRLSERGQTIEHVFRIVSQSQAEHQVAIGNNIGSLRLLGATDWRSFVESVSIVDATLRADPAGVYSAMDFTTRDQYRRAVEEIAKRSPASEDHVARRAVELATEARARAERPSQVLLGPPSDLGAHVGYFLLDAGRRSARTSRLGAAALDVSARPDGRARCLRRLRVFARPDDHGRHRRPPADSPSPRASRLGARRRDRRVADRRQPADGRACCTGR